jgi:hypothetical protein
VALLFSLMAAAYGDNNWPAGINEHLDSLLFIGGSWLAGWCVWAAVFYLYCRRDPSRAGNAVRWLIKGSVLELLVAVPAHVIVRRRDDCCAPAVTGFGIATGTAVMLMCLGPGVLALYRRRMLAYRRRS